MDSGRQGRAWEEDYAKRLEGVGLRRGTAAPTIFNDKERDLQCVAHGDDFTFLGYDEDLDFIQAEMGKWDEIKVRGRLGPDAQDDKQIVILGRTVTWTKEGIEYKADKRHRELILDTSR